ncbi:MAG: hypothetical protein IPH57_09980 [Saprospiraceae bacterium]|nr:hypothetical protein [Saprospiraceae bacterium]
MSEDNISSMWTNLIDEVSDQHHIDHVDIENYIVYYFDVDNDGITIVRSYKLEERIKIYLNQKYTDIIHLIDNLIIELNPDQQASFKAILTDKIEIIKRANSNALSIFPSCEDFLNKIIGYFDRFSHINGVSPVLDVIFPIPLENSNKVTIDFGYIIKFRIHLHKIHEIAIEESIINSNTNLAQFENILTIPDSVNTLRFICETKKAVCFLSSIKKMFKGLTPINIEKSKRFITRSGKFLTEDNYYTSSYRLKNDISKEITRLQNKIKRVLH